MVIIDRDGERGVENSLLKNHTREGEDGAALGLAVGCTVGDAVGDAVTQHSWQRLKEGM
jgi:hypothetical protein